MCIRDRGRTAKNVIVIAIKGVQYKNRFLGITYLIPTISATMNAIANKNPPLP